MTMRRWITKGEAAVNAGSDQGACGSNEISREDRQDFLRMRSQTSITTPNTTAWTGMTR